MLTNIQSAQIIEELVKTVADYGEQVTITPVDEEALIVGVIALREVERLRGTIRDIYAIVCEELAEPPSGTGPLVRIGTLIEERELVSTTTTTVTDTTESTSAENACTPDPRDARIEELEAALHRERIMLDDVDSGLSKAYAEIHGDIKKSSARIKAALKGAAHDAR